MGDMKYSQQTVTEMIQSLFLGYAHEKLLTPEVLKSHVEWAITQDEAVLKKVFNSENHPNGPSGMPYQPNLEGLKFLAKKLRGDDIQYRPYTEDKYEGNDCRLCNGWDDVYDFVWTYEGPKNRLGEPVGFYKVEFKGKCICEGGDATPGPILAALLEQYPNLPARKILVETMLQQMAKLSQAALMRPDDLKKVAGNGQESASPPLSGVEPCPVPDSEESGLEAKYPNINSDAPFKHGGYDGPRKSNTDHRWSVPG